MSKNDNPFYFLEDFEISKVAQILSSELPFVAGAALSRTSPIFNAKVMANMPDGIRSEIASAISKYRKIPVEVLYDIAEELEKKLRSPLPGKFATQKSSMLANLDLGAIMQDINNLKSRKKPTEDSGSKPEPVESRIISPEEYDTYLRGGIANSHDDDLKLEQEFSKLVDPQGFIPDNHHKKAQTARSGNNRETDRRSEAAAELSPETRKELALQQALLHTRSKKQETKVTRPAAGNTTKNKSYKAQKIDGMALAAHILRESSPELKKMVMQEIPELYTKLNERMFDFADLEHSNRDAIGRIFTGLDPHTSAIALRFASDHLKNTALTSVSRRKAKLIIDEFKRTAKEKVRLTEIEDAQQEVIDYAILLQNRGEIIIDPDDSGIV